jgi:hypothetical protein
MTSIPTLQLKQGETFEIELAYREDDGITKKSLEGVTLSSQIRDGRDKSIATLVLDVLNRAEGVVLITAPDGTAKWPIGTLYWDIKEQVAGFTKITNTSTIIVDKPITRV